MSKNLTVVMKNVGKSLMNTIQMGFSYDWSEESRYSEVKDRYADIKKQLKEIIGDISVLSVEELKELGFSKWDDESNLYLVPLWIFDLIEDGTELTSISGNKKIKGKDDIDLDIRFGCIAWGIEK